MSDDLILALDTGTDVSSVALVGRGIRLVRHGPVKTHGPTVLVTTREVLSEAGVVPQDLAAIACGRGPGSFTGLRIGLATAKGLCYALSVPLLLPSSLEALARATPRQGAALIVACTDARRQEIFAAAYAYASGDGIDAAPVQVMPPVAGGPQQLADHLGRLEADRLTLVGNGATLYRQALATLLGDRALFPEPSPQTPNAGILADMARELLAAGLVAELAAAEPEYLRPSDAEINRAPGGAIKINKE